MSVGDDEGSEAGIGVYAGLSQYFGSAVFWLWMPLLSFKMARDGMADEAPSMPNRHQSAGGTSAPDRHPERQTA